MAPQAKRLSLSEYAAANPPRSTKCTTCGLPERAEIDEQRRNGMGVATIFKWLTEVCGYTYPQSRYQSHFANGHHKRQA